MTRAGRGRVTELSAGRKIQVGMAGEVYPEIGGRYVAHVTVVDRVYDAASATIGVRLELPNPDNAIPAGLSRRVRFLGTG